MLAYCACVCIIALFIIDAFLIMESFSINKFIECSECNQEFTTENYPITLMCGHNFCKRCLSSKDRTRRYTCLLDNISQEVQNQPSVDYIYLMNIAKTIPELYRPMDLSSVSTVPSERHYRWPPIFSPPERTLSRKVCVYYLRGKCRFGTRCWNLHKSN